MKVQKQTGLPEKQKKWLIYTEKDIQNLYFNKVFIMQLSVI